MTATDRRHLGWFFLLALLVLGAGYGLREPWPADEPRFVLVAKQMVESGDFLFPHRGSELYPDKPPLYFWLLSASFALVGSWRWSFLLPSLLASLGTLWLTYDLGRRLWSPRTGLWAAAMVLASVQFVYQAKRAQIDPTLVFFTTLAFYGLCRHLLLGPAWRWYLAGCFAAGLGVISKGVGFLPLLALLPFALMARRGWQGLAPRTPGQGLRWSAGALAFLAAIALWLVPVLATGLTSGNPEHAQYLQNILFKQTAQRYVDPWHHYEAPWYFLQIIAMFWLPFSLALPWLLKPWAAAWRARDARVWLPLAWVLLVLVFFSASPAKRDMYILPALPALALAASPFLAGILAAGSLRNLLPQRLATAWPRLASALARVTARHVLLAFVAGLGAALLAIGAWALLGEPRLEQRLVAERGLGPEAVWLWAMLAVVGGAMLLAALAWRTRGAARACVLGLALLWCGYGFVVHPLLDDESSARKLMLETRARAGDDTVVGLVGWREQNLLQAVGPVAEFGFLQPDDVQLQRGLAWLRQAPGRVLLVREDDDFACLGLGGPGTERVGAANRRHWWLVSPAAGAACTGDVR